MCLGVLLVGPTAALADQTYSYVGTLDGSASDQIELTVGLSSRAEFVAKSFRMKFPMKSAGGNFVQLDFPTQLSCAADKCKVLIAKKDYFDAIQLLLPPWAAAIVEGAAKSAGDPLELGDAQVASHKIDLTFDLTRPLHMNLLPVIGIRSTFNEKSADLSFDKIVAGKKAGENKAQLNVVE